MNNTKDIYDENEVKEINYEDDGELEMKLEIRDHPQITYTERFNADKLAYIIKNEDKYRQLFKNINPDYDPFVIGAKYLENSHGGVAKVSYFQPRKGIGRFYAKGSLSMQNMKRELRHAIGGEYYHDLDVVNCHPVILMQMCGSLGIDCPLLTAYVNDRDAILNSISTAALCDPSFAKCIILCLINGGRGDYNTLVKKCRSAGICMPVWLSQFKRESAQILNRITDIYNSDYEEHKSMLIKNKIEKNPKASFNSLVMCNYENDILFAILEFMKHNGYIQGDAVLCFDGCQLRKDRFESLNELEALLPECEAFVLEKTTFNIKLKIKPMNEGFPVPMDGDVLPVYVDDVYGGFVFDSTDYANIWRSDTGLSEIYVRYASSYVKCYNADGDAYVWDSKRLVWLDTSHKHVVNQISPLLDRCILQFIKSHNDDNPITEDSTSDEIKNIKLVQKQLEQLHKKVLGHSGSINIFAKARSTLMDLRFIQNMNCSPHELPIRGGMVVDLRSGTEHKRCEKDLWSFELDVSFKGINCDFTEVLKFINPVFCFDYEMVSYMQKQIGTTLTGVLVRLLYIWYGEGRNGKSSLCALIHSILSVCSVGSANICGALSKEIFIKDPKSMKGSKSQHTAHLMPLKGLRCGMTIELSENERLDDQMVKLCTGGDSISVRGLNRDQEEFIPIVKPIIPTNMKPTVDGSMLAIVDRLSYAEFRARFVSQDGDEKIDPQNYKYAANPEYSPENIVKHSFRDAAFTWFVVGAMRYYTEGLKPPSSVTDFKTKSLRDSDIFAQFMAEECRFDNDREKYLAMDKVSKDAYHAKWSISLNKLHNKFVEYCDGDDVSKMSNIKFGKRCRDMKLLEYRDKRGKYFVGLQFIHV